MNRAQRRAAERARPMPPRRKFIPKPMDELEQFDTIERLFQKLRHGSVETDGRQVVIMSLQGEFYAVLPAMDGWLEYWQEVAARFQVEYDDKPLRKLQKSLEYDKPLTTAEVDAAYAVVQKEREMFRSIPRNELSKIAIEIMRRIQTTEEIREFLKERREEAAA